MTDAATGLRPLTILAALGTGGLLSLMVLCNARIAAEAGPLAASLVPHGTGMVAALAALALLRRRAGPAPMPGPAPRAPLWAYLGGLSGAATVMLSSVTANTALALSGTLALGLLGQVAFGLAADRWGLLGMARRRMTARDAGVLALVMGGSATLIFGVPR